MSKFKFHPFPKLSTDQLVLRKFKPEDIPAIFQMRSNENNQTYLDRPITKSLKEATEFVDKILTGMYENRWIMWGIERKTDKAFVGSICLWNLNEKKMTGELGY